MIHTLTLACSLLLLLATAADIGLPIAAEGAQVSVGIEHDLSKPTFGLQGPTSSQMTYDERNGLNLKGTVNDILGPPIKIANGFQDVMTGSGKVGLGAGLKTGGAVLGFDAKLLETAGLGHLLKGGLLMGGAMAKTGAATAIAGLPGKKISSIIEVPVKVVAMKDLAAGKALAGLGALKEVEAMVAKQKGATLIRDGEALKSRGYDQVRKGASEGMQNLNNMLQQTSGNAASAFKLLPLILDIPQPQQQQQIEQQQQPMGHHQAGGLFGGPSPFDPLLSALSGAASTNANNAQQHHLSSPFSLFGPHHNGFAAVLNSSSPLTNLLTNQSLNPFLMPISGGLSGPLASPLGHPMFGKPGPMASSNSLLPMLAGQMSGNPPPVQATYNWFPGVKVTETSQSHLPTMSQTFLNSPSIFRDPQQFLQVNQQNLNKQTANQAPLQQQIQEQVQEPIHQQTLQTQQQQVQEQVKQPQQQQMASKTFMV